MNFAKTNQTFQDWFTQQWVILWGRKINSKEFDWLKAPFGKLNGIGEGFLEQLATEKSLDIVRNTEITGLIRSINDLNLSASDLQHLDGNVIDFYEKTSGFDLKLQVEWNPFFRFFGVLLNKLFSERIDQLNIPVKNLNGSEEISNEIITLRHKETQKVEYTAWIRKFISSGKLIYSGLYDTCTIPSGEKCIKAVFPLPNGNATVILLPEVGLNGELILNSAGKSFGDPGFYFQLYDSRDNHWAEYISSFTDKLTVSEKGEYLIAEQIFRVWGFKVVQFNYRIYRKKAIQLKFFQC